MKYPLEALLDASIAQLNSGADIEDVLSAHPETADELRPLLVAAALVRVEAPSRRSRAEGKQRLMESVAERRRLVEAVDGYITELKAGVPLKELLARIPTDIRPVLLAAARVRFTEIPTPDAEKIAEGKRLLMAAVERRRDARARTRRAALVGLLRLEVRDFVNHFIDGLTPAPSAQRRVRNAALSLMVTLGMVLSMSGVHGAAADSLPGDTFYSVKRIGESAQLVFTFDAARRATLSLEFADRRLAEMRALAAYGQSIPAGLVEDWLMGQNHAWSEIRRLPADQRMLLAEMLLTGGLDGADEVRRIAGEEAENVLVRSDALESQVRQSLDPVLPVAEASRRAPTAHLEASGPMAVPRPLPNEDSRPDRSDTESAAAESSSESPVVERPEPPAAPSEEPDTFVQPVLQPGPEQGDADDDNDPGSEAPAGDEPAAGEPTEAPDDESPPSFSNPIFGTATPTPPPGDGDGDGNAEQPEG